MMFIQSMFLSMIGIILWANSSQPDVFFADINTFSDVNRIYITRRVQETRSAVALLFWQRSAGENGGRFHALFIFRAWWSNSESTFRAPEVFFSLAARCFGGGSRPTKLRPLAEATGETETSNEKSLAPRNTESDFLEIIVLYYEHESSPQTKQNSLVKSVCTTASIEILVLGSHMCTKIAVSTTISLPQRKFEKHIR